MKTHIRENAGGVGVVIFLLIIIGLMIYASVLHNQTMALYEQANDTWDSVNKKLIEMNQRWTPK